MSKSAVSQPCSAYSEYYPKWRRCRDACGGIDSIKVHDVVVTTGNYLLPFSPSMDIMQYRFFQAESEYPGIVVEYARMLVGGLVRKQPQITFPKQVSEEDRDWIIGSFSRDGGSLVSFLSQAIWEEILTSRVWVHVDYPQVDLNSGVDTNSIRPYPVLWTAESVISWSYDNDGSLKRVIVTAIEEVPNPVDEFQTFYRNIVYVHEVLEGVYSLRRFISEAATSPEPADQYDTTIVPRINGNVLSEIPAWPLNGRADLQEPLLLPLVDREIALYNKLSRRNHLLYCASTYTPVIASDMGETEFEDIVNKGIGTWIKLQQGDTITVLETPTGALKDMESAIECTVSDMAKMGIRMLAPENSQSGVALDIRSAGQVAKLASMNTQISTTLSKILAHMLSYRLSTPLLPNEIPAILSADFDPNPIGAEWLRLVTEWYEKRLIPRSLWLAILKGNDIISSEYDDTKAKVEITQDEVVPRL